MGYTPSSQGSPTFCGFSLPGSRGPRVLCPAQDDHSWIVGAAPSGPVRQSLQSQEGPIMDSVGRGRAVRLRVGGGDPQAWWAQPIMGPQDPQGGGERKQGRRGGFSGHFSSPRGTRLGARQSPCSGGSSGLQSRWMGTLGGSACSLTPGRPLCLLGKSISPLRVACKLPHLQTKRDREMVGH